MTALFVLDFLSVVTLSVSGCIVAARNGFDWFGMASMGFITAVGGGTVRDVILGETPSWITHPESTYGIVLGLFITVVAYKWVLKLHKTLTLFDAMGIALAAMTGATKAIDFDATISATLVLAVVSSTFGGVLRDTICNEVPLIFRKEIYATACMAGALLFYVLMHFQIDKSLALWIGASFVFTIRIVAVRFNVGLPSYTKK